MKKELNPNWVKDAIFYQIFPERFFNGNPENDPPNTVPWESKPTRNNFFGGDLEGIIKKLDYLKELGINAIYLNPIFKSESNHKYNTEDYLSIDPHFGDLSIFRKLLSETHKLSIKIILDGVFNHASERFWAFDDLVNKGPKSEFKDWFYISDFPIIKKPKPNYLTFGEEYKMPKLRIENNIVKEYIFSIIRFWGKYGIDGWRLDVPFLIKDKNFWKTFRKIVKEINPNSYLVGEIWENASLWLKGDEFDGTMNYRLRKLIIDFFVKKKISTEVFTNEIKKLLKDYSWDATLSNLNLLGSHDTERYLTLCKNNYDVFLLSYIFLFTFPGIPMIYYGDEIGMVGGEDPDCRKTMVWDRGSQNLEILKFIKKLIKARNSNKCLKTGKIEIITSNTDGLFIFKRYLEEEEFIIILNRAKAIEDYKLELGSDAFNSNETFKDLITGRKYILLDNKISFHKIERISGLILKKLYT